MSASGMTVYMHYCCGKLDEVKIVPAKKFACHQEAEDIADTGCGDDSKSDHSDCCFNQTVELKIQSDQEKLIVSKPLDLTPAVLTHRLSFLDKPQSFFDHISLLPEPPASQKLPVFISNRVFRI